MPRQPRFFFPGAVLHIVQRGINRSAIFRGTGDRRHYLDCLRLAAANSAVALHAYVLMSNHVHLLVSPGDECSAPRMMQMIGRRYVAWFNFVSSRTGALWEGRYKAAIVDTDAYFFACMRYIELNPVRAGIVQHPAAYAWSSYRSNAGLASDVLVTPHSAFAALAPTDEARRRVYRAGFDRGVDLDVLDAIRDATQHQWGLGTATFRARVAEVTGRRAERRPLGRPSRFTPARRS